MVQSKKKRKCSLCSQKGVSKRRPLCGRAVRIPGAGSVIQPYDLFPLAFLLTKSGLGCVVYTLRLAAGFKFLK